MHQTVSGRLGTEWVQVIAHDAFPRLLEKLLPRSCRRGGPHGRGVRWCAGKNVAVAFHRHTKHTWPPPAPPASLLPVMLSHQGNPHGHGQKGGLAGQDRCLTVVHVLR